MGKAKKAILTVFLCSTYNDLAAERDAVLGAIRKLQLQHDSMEFFGARTSLPIETCLEEVRNSDILVVIVGHKYGTLVPDKAISFSEAEYTEGYNLRKPCLVYMRSEDVPILPKYMERDPQKLSALESFKKTLRGRHTVANFSDASDLAVSVTADLSRTVQALEETSPSGKGEKKPSSHSILEDINSLVQQALDKKVPEEKIWLAMNQAIMSLLTAEGKYDLSVFLSYSHLDSEVVTPISSGLREHGLRVWLDQDAISYGQSLSETIFQGLARTDFLIFFLSAHSINSQWARLELNNIMSRRIRGRHSPLVLPVLLDDTEVPALLRDVKYLDLRDHDIERGVREISNAIKRYAGRIEKIKDVHI